MKVSTVAHDTFAIERTYDIPIAQVFRAWADPLLKARWFAGTLDELRQQLLAQLHHRRHKSRTFAAHCGAPRGLWGARLIIERIEAQPQRA